ncbi:MAG: hypothetical protein ACOCRK_10600 [bacterium]
MKYKIKKLYCGEIEEKNHKTLALYNCLNCGQINPKIEVIDEEDK